MTNQRTEGEAVERRRPNTLEQGIVSVYLITKLADFFQKSRGQSNSQDNHNTKLV